MKTNAKWVGRVSPAKWVFKKDMPAELRAQAYAIDFGLFGYAFVAMDENKTVLMRDGSRVKTCKFYLKTPGVVVGIRDAGSAFGMRWENEWVEAFHSMVLDEIELRKTCVA